MKATPESAAPRPAIAYRNVDQGRLDHQARLALNEREAAAMLGVSLSWLQHDRLGARHVPFYRLGRNIRYSPTRVAEALAALEEGGTAALRKAR